MALARPAAVGKKKAREGERMREKRMEKKWYGGTLGWRDQNSITDAAAAAGFDLSDRILALPPPPPTKTSVSGSMIRVPHSTFRRQPRTRRINDLSSRRSRTTITIHTAMTRAMYSLTCQPPHRSVFHCKECRRLSSARYGAGGLTCFCLVRLFVFITVINIPFLARYYFNPYGSHYFFAPLLWSHMGHDISSQF